MVEKFRFPVANETVQLPFGHKSLQSVCVLNSSDNFNWFRQRNSGFSLSLSLFLVRFLMPVLLLLPLVAATTNPIQFGHAKEHKMEDNFSILFDELLHISPAFDPQEKNQIQ